MKINKLDLLSKGWTAQEVEKASKIIADAEDKKHETFKFIDHILYWSLLMLMLIGNTITAVLIIPFIFAIQSWFAAVIVIIIGLLFGVIISILIGDIDRVDIRYSKNLFMTLIFTALINMGLLAYFSYDFSTKTGLILVHNIYAIAAIYIVSFLAPHFVYMYRQNLKQGS